jgi:hypothetical protein
VSAIIRAAAERVLAASWSGLATRLDCWLLSDAAALAPNAGAPSDATAALIAHGARAADTSSDDTIVWNDAERLASNVPVTDRASALWTCEALLARVSPECTWDLHGRVLGAETRLASPVLGLDLAARLEQQRVRDLFAKKQAHTPLFAAQLRADGLARAGVRDELLDDPSRVRHLRGGECASILVGASKASPADAVRDACTALRYHDPYALSAALWLVAESAVRAGHALAVAAEANAASEGSVLVHAIWTEAAARARAIDGPAVRRNVARLLARAAEELDPGRELLAQLPGLCALAWSGDAALLIDELRERCIAPPLFLNAIVHGEMSAAAAALLAEPTLKAWLGLPRAEWCESPLSLPVWAEDHDVALGCAVLTVVAHAPSVPHPGSLADVTHW